MAKDIIRGAFNAGNYWQRAESEEFIQVIEKEKHPFPPPRGEELCCWSQYVVYRTRDGRFVGGVHQYRRQDGTLGGSGKPDPKALIHEGRYLKVVG